jgi:hypothetical protein
MILRKTDGPHSELSSTDAFPGSAYSEQLNAKFKTSTFFDYPKGQSHNGTAVTWARDQIPLVTSTSAQQIQDLDRNSSAYLGRRRPAVLAGRPREPEDFVSPIA